MKKIIATVLIVLAMAAVFAGCSSKCKESGCSEKVYKNGYCELHYAMHAIGDMFS